MKNHSKKNINKLTKLIIIQVLYYQFINSENTKNIKNILGLVIKEIEEEFNYSILSKVDIKFIEDFINIINENKEATDQQIKLNLSKNIKFENIDPIILQILRTGICELNNFINIPKNVIIDQYVTITNHFCSEKEVGFVNGLLDKIAEQLREL